MGSVMTCKELSAVTGYRRPADQARGLRDQGITVFDGLAGPWTTVDLINNAGGINKGRETEAYSPSIL